ncbi:hypothetical protein IQ07DRAFT_207298 [Pyrenochaeta sp. DS3sAY3a]|nr:hypothetical protein IQ07DRAFT_207298 [Pyrenochaeta sp. DS3sAY3a]
MMRVMLFVMPCSAPCRLRTSLYCCSPVLLSTQPRASRSWSYTHTRSFLEQDPRRLAATGVRDGTGAVLAVIAFLVICYSLWHSLRQYKPRPSFELP